MREVIKTGNISVKHDAAFESDFALEKWRVERGAKREKICKNINLLRVDLKLSASIEDFTLSHLEKMVSYSPKILSCHPPLC